MRPIPFLYHLLVFLLPLVFFPRTSELFEFNKIVVLYTFTILIGAFWIATMISRGRVIFRRTSLDIPLALFLITQGISTIISIDYRTSLLGYYSRFNGGFVSSLCYAFLYWIYVSTLTSKDTKKTIRVLLLTTAIASIYGVLEHFGRSPSCLIINGEFNIDCWVQDVKNRIFATFGQPNWMAAWLTAVIPLTWSLALIKHSRKKLSFVYSTLSVFFFIALLYTKSRSALLSLVLAGTLYGVLLLKKRQILNNLAPIGFIGLGSIIALIAIGTPWTPTLQKYLLPTATEPVVQTQVIEEGGTESGEIRKIVWQGAVDVWRRYPIIGSGVETFAFSYYETRPLAHNLVSEWNFLYNKAHNEYLNFLATTGVAGFIAYVLIVLLSLFVLVRNLKFNSMLNLGILAGYISILITNFFGFSVVAVSFLFFLFPALSISISDPIKKISLKTNSLPLYKRLQLSGLVFLAGFLLFSVAKYWYADFTYAQALSFKSRDISAGVEHVKTAISMTPSEPLFHDELADMYSLIATANQETEESAYLYSQLAFQELEIANNLSPRNIKILKSRANILADLAEIDPTYFADALKTLEKLAKYAPTDPSVFYSTALTYARMDDPGTAIELLNKTIQMKPNYRNARLLLSLLYKEQGNYQKAIAELEYVLQYISPDDSKIQEEIENLKLKQ